MMDLKGYPDQQTKLADYLPWAAMVSKCTILNKDGSFLAAMRFRGPDHESAGGAEMGMLAARMNHLLKQFGSGWAFYVEACRTPITSYPESDFPDPVSKLVDEERRARFEASDRHYETRHYLSIQYLPPIETNAKAESWLFERTETSQDNSYRDQLTRFEDHVDKVCDGLAVFMPEIEILTGEHLLTYLHQTISSKNHSVSVPGTPMYLDALLSDTPLTGGVQPNLGDLHVGVIGILGLPDMTEPGFLDALQNLPFSYRQCTRFIHVDKDSAEKLLNRYRRQWFSKRKGLLSLLKETLSGEPSVLVDTDADNKAADVTAALEEVGADLVSYGYLTLSIVVTDQSEASLKEKLRSVEQCLNGQGLVTREETLNAVEAWLATVPGQAYANVRMPLVNSLNLAHMLPLSAPWAGPEKNAHLNGPALLVANTRSSIPFRLVTHVGDVGHTLIVGPTGAGKSVLLNLLALQFRRYEGAQVFLFDKGGSSRATILAMGGTYMSADHKHGYQPLARIDERPVRTWARDWLLALFESEGLALTPEIKDSIWQALVSLSTAPKQQRTLTGFCMLLADTDLAEALKPYTLEGSYGHLFDGSENKLSLSDLQSFEMEGLLEHPQAAVPILSYLFMRLEEKFSGTPTLLILDEAWLYLDNPQFAGKLREWLKTLRKKNVSVIFATQSLADIAGSEIATSLIESCPTRIFLPNERALEPGVADIYSHFGLSDRQLQLIAEAIPKRDYYVTSTKGSRLFDLDIGPLAHSLLSASTPNAHRLMDQLLEECPSHSFAEQFFVANDLGWASDLIRALSTSDTSHPKKGTSC